MWGGAIRETDGTAGPKACGQEAARREREQVPLAGAVRQGRSGAKANPPPGCGNLPPALRREAVSPAGVGVLPCTGV